MLKRISLFVLVISFGISLLIFKSYNYESNSSFIRSEGENEESLEKKKQTAIERNEYFFMLLRDPRTNSIPENIREKEIAFASKIPKSEERLMKGLNALAFNWKEAGPFDVGGRTRTIAIDIASSNNVIAAGVSGGIWKSTDKGATWYSKSSKTGILSVTSIAQDPRPSFQTYWYAVGGEFDGNSARSRGGNASFYGGGFYKSTDNGETWNLIQYANSLYNPSSTSWNSYFSYASKVVVSPTGNVFVCSNAGAILKSTDGGSTWTINRGQLNDHYYTDLIINKNGVMVSYLSQLNSSGTNLTVPGLFKSTDDGLNWSSITPVDFPTSFSRSVMSFSTSNPNLFFSLTNTGIPIGSPSKDDVRLFKINISTGVSTDLSANLPDFTSTNSKGYFDTQGDYNMAIAVHPQNENIVFIGGTNLFRSLDGFATKLISPTNDPKINWIGGYGYISSFFYPGLHPDIHTIVFDQNNPNQIWVGHDGGISYYSDATTTNYPTFFPWVNMDNHYNVTQYYTMAISATFGDTRIFGGTQDNGSPFFRWDGTTASSSIDVTTGDGSYSYIGSQVFNYYSYSYGSTQNGSVYRFGTYYTGDINTSNWSEITPVAATGMKFVNPFAVDPSDENFMYYIAGNILWRDSSLSTIPLYQNKTSQGWKSIDLQIGAGYSFSTLAVSRTQNILYLAASSTSSQPKIYKMSNSKTSTTATEITPSNFPALNIAGGVPNGSYIHGIAINSDNANEVLVVLSNYNVKSLWYTNDGGASWSDVEGNLSGPTGPSVRSATILPTTSSTSGKVYLIGTSTGVYSTTLLNGSSTLWAQEGSNVIGNVVVEYITSRKSDGTVVAATHGRGAFVGTNYIQTGIENENNLPTSFQLEQNYPNPFNPTTVISYQLSAVSNVKLQVYDVLGKLVATLVNGKVEAGNHKVDFNASMLASGVYIYKLTTGNYNESKKMILMK
ncbi:MAG: T9SS type A sorting domain-containing protein [Ignavibacteriales bacterium]|nr:T9SS type A sorting domain-containing protein [Ignavibacteriales bacterium]